MFVYVFSSLFLFASMAHGEDEYVRVHIQADQEIKRSTENQEMPHRLLITQTFRGETTAANVYLIPSMTAHTRDGNEHTELSDHGLYKQDIEDSYSLFIIERKTDGKYIILEGMFNSGDSMYEIESELLVTDKESRAKRDEGHMKIAANPYSENDKTMDDIVKLENYGPETVLKEIKENAVPTKQTIEAESSTENDDDDDDDDDDIEHHVIEVCTYVDFDAYETWRNLVGYNKAIKRLKLQISYYFETAQISYRKLNIPDKTVELSGKYVHIITNKEDRIVHESANVIEALTNFTLYVQSQSSICDHYTYVTTQNIGALGVAYLGAGCTASSTSVVVDTGNGAAGNTWAHEIGHSFNSLHDGDKGCTTDDHWVMARFRFFPYAQETRGHRWRFSRCSRRQINFYLNRIRCTLPAFTDSKNVFPDNPATRKGGQVYSRDKQCRHALRNRNSAYCPDVQEFFGVEDSLCLGMYCYLPTNPGFCSPFNPLEFTPCSPGDDTKVCRAGRCQQDCSLLRRRCLTLKRRQKRMCLRDLRKCRRNDRY